MSMVDVLNGNQAAAKGAALSRPDVVAAYPITPQTRSKRCRTFPP